MTVEQAVPGVRQQLEALQSMLEDVTDGVYLPDEARHPSGQHDNSPSRAAAAARGAAAEGNRGAGGAPGHRVLSVPAIGPQMAGLRGGRADAAAAPAVASPPGHSNAALLEGFLGGAAGGASPGGHIKRTADGEVRAREEREL
jgi:hypothetical protein